MQFLTSCGVFGGSNALWKVQPPLAVAGGREAGTGLTAAGGSGLDYSGRERALSLIHISEPTRRS
eukprot:4386001-Prymnesium_polylepis.1